MPHDVPPAPAVGDTTRRLYDRLPEFYRDADVEEDYALLRYLSLVVDQASELETLRGRLADGDLGDPYEADAAWLPWLGQLVGVRVNPADSEASVRDNIAYASAGWRAGTKAGIAAAARTALTGTKLAQVYDHSINSPGDGGQWDVLLVTASSETPDVDAVLDTVVAKGAKPAGVILRHRAYSASWDAVEATYTTWGAIEAAGTWTAIQETGL